MGQINKNLKYTPDQRPIRYAILSFTYTHYFLNFFLRSHRKSPNFCVRVIHQILAHGASDILLIEVDIMCGVSSYLQEQGTERSILQSN